MAKTGHQESNQDDWRQPVTCLIINERSCIRCGLCVDWCPTECLTMDHFRVTPAEERESVDLAIVADG